MKPVKKDEGRFNISFDLNDLRHKRVVDVLNTAGRRKAAFLVDAATFYLAYLERNGVGYGMMGEFPPVLANAQPLPESSQQYSQPYTQPYTQPSTAAPVKPIPDIHTQTPSETLIATTKTPIVSTETDYINQSTHNNCGMRQAALEGLSMFNGN